MNSALDVGRTASDALRSLKRYVSIALGDDWEVRLGREEGAFDRPFARVWQVTGSTYPLTGGRWLSDVVTPFVISAYPLRQETSDAAVLSAQAVEDTLYRAFRVGVGDGRALRVPLVNYTGVGLNEPGVWFPVGFMRVNDLSTQPFPDPDDDRLWTVVCDVRLTWRRLAETIPSSGLLHGVSIGPTGVTSPTPGPVELALQPARSVATAHAVVTRVVAASLDPSASATTVATVVLSTPTVPFLPAGASARAAAAATVTVPAAPALTAVAFFGDSFSEGGTNGDPASVRFPTQTATRMGVTELNFGKGGARQNLNRVSGAADILTQIYQAAQPPSHAPYAPMYQAAVIQCSINNLNLNTVHADLTIVTRALLRGVHRIRSGGAYEVLPSTGGPWTFDLGSWSDVPTIDANTGTGIERAFANGCRATLVTPSDFPGGHLRVYGPMTTGFGGIETFAVDGAANGTSDNRGSALQSGSQSWEHDCGALAAGARTIRATVSSINTVENINGADFEVAGTKPVVIVLNTARSPNYPGGEHSIADADVTASNGAVSAALASEFPSDPKVVLVDIDAVLSKNPANFGADLVHPNSTGAGLIAAAIQAAINAALP